MTDVRGNWPTFIVIGAPKSGTTALYHYVRQHPQVYLSPEKEPRFFAFEGARPDYRGPCDETRTNRQVVTEASAYLSLFAGATSAQHARGEMSTVYLYFPGSAERMRHHVPEARLIAILRQPVDRAFSNYAMALGEGREPERDFARAVRAEPDRIRSGWAPEWHYLARGFYAEQLERYFAAFDRSQIRVYLHEDLLRDPLALLRDFFAFIGVDEAFVPDVSRRHNESRVPRSQVFQRFLTQSHPLKQALQTLVPASLARSGIAALKRLNLARPRLDPALRRSLTEGYRDDILRLQELIGRDLSHWLGAAPR